jgi:PhoH-like ATPase
VTKDVNLRIRADSLGLTSMDFEAERIDIDELYSGMIELPVAGSDVDAFYSQNTLDLAEGTFKSNQYVLLRDRDNPSHSALGRFDGNTKKLVPLRKIKEGIWGIRPRNKEQHCALDLLLADDVKLVTLVGKAGTGKTMLAIAAGLQKVVEEQLYSKLLVSRPIFPLGRDVGYLPGTIEEKLNPWMQPIYDNVEYLMGLSKSERKSGRSYQELIDMGFIEIEPLTYIRGRSIPNQFIIVDEAQNLTPHEVKTIITRVGEATKVILTGDPYQIDNPYVDATSNGLTTVVEKFKGENVAGHVTLSKGERSALAELASNVL